MAPLFQELSLNLTQIGKGMIISTKLQSMLKSVSKNVEATSNAWLGRSWHMPRRLPNLPGKEFVSSKTIFRHQKEKRNFLRLIVVKKQTVQE